MNENIVNPFKQQTTNWANKNFERLENAKKQSTEESIKSDSYSKNINNENKKDKTPTRIAKSFKVFPGELLRNFDKRINKMQVHFDELDYEKNYVDSGKYLMFIMAFAEKYKLYELYAETDSSGNIKIENSKISEHFKRY